MAPTTTDELRHYLNSKSIPAASVEALSGGTANYVWRITTLLGRSSIIKHAEPFVATNPGMKFPVERMGFEAKALREFSTLLPEDEVVRLPALYHYDEEAHVLNIADGGSRTLKEAYSDEGVDVVGLGERIGKWLARFHASTTKEELRSQFNNAVAKAIYRYNYNNLSSTLQSQGLDGKLGERINEKYGALLATDDLTICHGDFWPGNILLSDHHSSPEEITLTVVDWEMIRNGNGVTDIGQFAAEAWLLDRFRGGRGLLDAFLKGYLELRKLGREDAVRVAVQFGTHISFWTTQVKWGTEEETKECVKYGSEVLKKVESGDWVWLRGAALGGLFESKDEEWW
jgi:thiamine kinase-like enzyme